VRIGDGCATVSGYRLPIATGWLREGGSEVGNPKSGYRQDRARLVPPGGLSDCQSPVGRSKDFVGPGPTDFHRDQLLRTREG
jgi:hypothetical protein